MSGLAHTSDSVLPRVAILLHHGRPHIGTANLHRHGTQTAPGVGRQTRASICRPPLRSSRPAPFFGRLCALRSIAGSTRRREVLRCRWSTSRIRIGMICFVGIRTAGLWMEFTTTILAAWYPRSILRLLKSCRPIGRRECALTSTHGFLYLGATFTTF